MIDTNSMYGNVAEEQDTFVQLQNELRKKAAVVADEAKAAAAKKYAVPGIDSKNAYESSKKITAEEQTRLAKVADDITIPEVDENYPANALKVMFDMQESLQNMLGKKRGTLTPDSKENLFVKSGMSIYHLGSVVTELFELDEQMQKDNYEITDASRFELTDAVHFLMNTLLYINMKPRETLEWYYDKAKEDFHAGTIGETSIRFLIGDYIIAFGQIMQQLPYKAWKTYDSFEPKVPYTVLYDMVDTLMIKFIKLYVALSMKPEDIWKFYYEKNRENFKRQQKNGRYEK